MKKPVKLFLIATAILLLFILPTQISPYLASENTDTDGVSGVISIGEPLAQSYSGSSIEASVDLSPSMQWNKTYGARAYGEAGFDIARSLVQTEDGGYALAGEGFVLAGESHNPAWLIKTDAAGNIQWNRTYEPNGTRYVSGTRASTCLIQVKDGGYLLAGNVEDPEGPSGDYWDIIYDAWLVRTDAFGNMLWNRTYGRPRLMDQVNCVVETSDGGFILAGRASKDASSSRTDAWLIKTDAAGNMQWNRTYGGLQRDRANSVIQTKDDGYALAGYTNEAPDYADYDASYETVSWLVKTDTSGNILWNQTYGGTISHWAESLIQTSDEGYVLAGTSSSLATSAGIGYDFWIAKTDASGTMQWNRTYSGQGTARALSTDIANCVTQTYDGYAVAGYTDSYNPGPYTYDDAWVIKTDLSGNMQWNKVLHLIGNDHAMDLVHTSDGGYALVGHGISGEFDLAWLIKLEPELSPLVEKNYDLNVGGHNFTLTALTNSSISDVDTSHVVSAKNMSFTVESSWGTSTCNLTIPNTMLGGPYVLMVGGEPPWSSTTTLLNSTHTSLYFTYNGTGKYAAEIVGATAVPEFNLPITILVYGILTLAVITLKKIRGVPKPFHRARMIDRLKDQRSRQIEHA